jgi:putative FmdB family regulatory protein
MPIYEYQCDACQKITEIMQKASDPAPSSCDTCGKGPMVKQLSLSAFALKGSGWYVTDFKGGQSAKPATDTPKSDPAPKASDPS